MTTPLPDSVLAALRAGEKIQAIKLLRQSRGIGLIEAKAIVDAATSLSPRQARHGPRTALGFAADHRPRSGPGPVVLVSLAAGVAAFLWGLISRR